MDNKTRYQRLKAAGLCVSCGKDVAAENSIHCEKCREMHRTVSRMYRVRLYYKRQEKHECVFCGVKLPPDHYYALCEKCREKNKARCKEYHRRKNEQSYYNGKVKER